MTKKSFRRSVAGTPAYPSLDRLGRRARLGLAAGAAAALFGSSGCLVTMGEPAMPDFDGGTDAGVIDGGEFYGGIAPPPDAGEGWIDGGVSDAGETDGGEFYAGIPPAPDAGEQ